MTAPTPAGFTGDPADFARFAELVPGGFAICGVRREDAFLYLNAAALEIFGCDSQEDFKEYSGGSFLNCVVAEDRPLVLADADRRRSGDAAAEGIEYRIRRKDGLVRWIADSARLVRTPDREQLFFLLLRDVTERRQVEQESRRRAEVIEGMSVDFTSIYLLNLDTGSMRPYRDRATALSALTEAMYANGENGADWRVVLPRYARDCVLEADRESFSRETAGDRIRQRLERDRAYSLDYRCADGAGGTRYLQMSVVGIHTPERKHHAVLGFRDITDQVLRLRQETEERLHMELELEQERRANEIKSAFLFNISHDIRTPMNAVMGYTTLARRHMDDPGRLREDLDKVEEASRHLLSLIDDLLEMSRIDYGKIELKNEPCSLTEELNTVVEMLTPEAEKKGVALEAALDLPEAEVLLDASRFRRIMANLVDNAVKFTPYGGHVRVTARQKQLSESGYARCEFVVSDDGVGIAPEYLDAIFLPFERERSATESGAAGAGLGLSIVKSLLDVMGGSIRVESRRGEGSAFIVDLPLKRADAAKTAAAPKQSAGLRADGERRILLVEDIEINRMLAETILEDAGFLVESVPDGCDAVDAIRDRPAGYYDLVLMDIQMPVMNGYEATRAIRSLGRADTDTLPIIALSANARDEDRRMSMASGMDNHIAKPFDVAHLIATVNEHISNRPK